MCRLRFARCVALGLLLLAPLHAPGQCAPSPGTSVVQPLIEHRRVYDNRVDGYRIAVPRGRIAYQVPGYDHGASIPSGRQASSFVWVDARPNNVDRVDSAKAYLDLLRRYAPGIDTTLRSHRSRIRLDGAPGMLEVRRYRCGPGGTTRVERQVIVIRHDTVYVVGLDTSAADSRREARVLAAVATSWRFKR